MVFLGINLVPRAFFLMQSNWLASFSNQSLCVKKEALETRLNGHAPLLSFQTQQEQTVFIWQEVVKAVARVQKKNTEAKG